MSLFARLLAAVALVVAGLPAAAMAARTGGVVPPGSQPAPATGTSPAPAQPRSSRPSLAGVYCSQNCVSLRAAVPGSLIEAVGSGLSGATRFELIRRHRTTSVPVLNSGEGSATGRLPARIRSGSYRVRVVAGGKRARAARKLLTIKGAPGSRFVSREGARVVASEATPRRLFIGSPRGAAFQFVVRAASRTPVRVDVVRAADGAVVRSLPADAPSNALSRVVWDGRDSAGAPVREGRYTFVAQIAGQAAPARRRARTSQAPNADSIVVVSHAFPILGPHQYGRGGGRFGAGRGGRSHQGQDVFAKCGTPLVAASGGTVTFNKFQSLAGNYLVIHGGDGIDYAYMHLRRRSPLKQGARVATGDPIGEVGQTGDARGCHLHFEEWRGAWQQGGTPIDPLPDLRSWD